MSCEICYVNLGSTSNAETHYKSKTHQDALQFQQDLKEDKLRSEFNCETCSCYTTSYKTLLNHLSSDKHKSRVEIRDKMGKGGAAAALPLFEDKVVQTSTVYCELCRLSFRSSDSYTEHLESEKHVKRVRYLDMLDAEELKKSSNESTSSLNSRLVNESTSSSDPIDVTRKKYLDSEWCHCCYIRYSSESHKIQHMSGKDHLKRFEFKEMGKESDEIAKSNGFYCSLCVALTNSEINHQTHLDSQIHLAQMSKFEEYERFNKTGKSFLPSQVVAVKKDLPKSKSMFSFQSPPALNKEQPAKLSIRKSTHEPPPPVKKSENTLEVSQSTFEYLESKSCDIYDKFNIKVYKFHPSQTENSQRVKLTTQKKISPVRVNMKENLFQMLYENMLENINLIHSVDNNNSEM